MCERQLSAVPKAPPTWFLEIALPSVHHPLLCRALSPYAARCAALAERFASMATGSTPGAHQGGELPPAVLGMSGVVGVLAAGLRELELQQGAQTSCQLSPGELAPLGQWMISMLPANAALLNHALVGTSATLLAELSAAPVGACAQGMVRLLEHCMSRTSKPGYTTAAEEARRCVPLVLHALADGLGVLAMPGKQVPTGQPAGVSWSGCSLLAQLCAQLCNAMDTALLAVRSSLSYPNPQQVGLTPLPHSQASGAVNFTAGHPSSCCWTRYSAAPSLAGLWTPAWQQAGLPELWGSNSQITCCALRAAWQLRWGSHTPAPASARGQTRCIAGGTCAASWAAPAWACTSRWRH